MKEIRGDAKSIRKLLGDSKFAIDYYQREYRWETKQVIELLNDLCNEFLEHHKPDNERSAVEGYGHYFLGSIIISDKDGRKFIIDGQQRLTSLTLLFIYIYRQLKNDGQKGQLTRLIFSQKYGKHSFNLEVDERTACMEALFNGQPFEEGALPESVVNILGRYQDIEEHLPGALAYNDGTDDFEKALLYFSDWLIDNVYLVEITAYSDADAYTIFETMNDRGLSLTPTDMLKGYLLANITDTDRRNSASRAWRDRVTALRNVGKDEDADAIKGWLRGQYAETIRERKSGAKPGDFDLIGTEFHRWVRDHEKEPLGLNDSTAFSRFIEEDFVFYGSWYERIRQAAEKLTEGLEAIYYNARNNFTLQYPVLLAPLVRTDREDKIISKLRIVAAFLDILIARRIWNWKSTSYSTMQYNMFRLVILDIRGKSPDELIDTLTRRLEAEEETFASNEHFCLHGQNGPQVHRLLARMTDFVETNSGSQSRYPEYIQRSGSRSYEIEHIWADHFERHEDEFNHQADFAEYRNRIGGLLLLPKSFNASYGDKPYKDKREHYFGHNLLAQSLYERAYESNPGFKRFREETGLVFQPHVEFKKADMDARQGLYQKLAEQIWNPDILRREAEA